MPVKYQAVEDVQSVVFERLRAVVFGYDSEKRPAQINVSLETGREIIDMVRDHNRRVDDPQ